MLCMLSALRGCANGMHELTGCEPPSEAVQKHDTHHAHKPCSEHPCDPIFLPSPLSIVQTPLSPSSTQIDPKP